MLVLYKILFKCIKKNHTLLITGREHRKSLLVQFSSVKQINTKSVCCQVSKFFLRCFIMFPYEDEKIFEYHNNKDETMYK